MPKAHLLLVEDDEALAELVRWHFEREEFDVRQTGDGEEALLMARERAPDLVLLDWMLENLSGIEVCRQLRKSEATLSADLRAAAQFAPDSCAHGAAAALQCLIAAAAADEPGSVMVLSGDADGQAAGVLWSRTRVPS